MQDIFETTAVSSAMQDICETTAVYNAMQGEPTRSLGVEAAIPATVRANCNDTTAISTSVDRQPVSFPVGPNIGLGESGTEEDERDGDVGTPSPFSYLSWVASALHTWPRVGSGHKE